MAPPKVTEEKKEKIRLRIMEKAIQVFSSKGLFRTTIDDIVSRKFSKGTIYNYFGSKDGLYLATMAELRSRWSQSDQSPLFKAETVKLQLEKLIIFLFRIYENVPPKDLAIQFENVSTALFHSNPAILESLKKDYLGRIDGFASIIQSGIDSGEFKADTDIHIISLLIDSTLQGVLLQSCVLGEEFDWNKIGTTVFGWIFNEIAA
jgi:AcrR family transcriptional regulator